MDEYIVDREDLAQFTAKHLLNQIGLDITGEVTIKNHLLFEEQISKLITPSTSIKLKEQLSNREVIQLTTETISRIEEECEGYVDKDILIYKMRDEHQIPQEETEKIIKNLIQKGVIYEPKKDMLKIVK